MTDGIPSEINKALRDLVGTPLWGSSRAADMEMFAFGRKVETVDRLGRIVTKGEFALHVQCAWHIEQSSAPVVGSRDLYLPADGVAPDDAFDWEPMGSNRRDVLLERLFGEITPEVEGVEAAWPGTVSVLLSQQCRLRLFPDRTGEEVEYWRFFRPGQDQPHVVLTSGGISKE